MISTLLNETKTMVMAQVKPSGFISKNIQTLLKRGYATSKLPLVISEEIQQALQENKPIVSLESTILTHGFPYPQNLQLGKEFEQAVRDEGGIPATIAFLKGKPHIGLNDNQLIELTENYSLAVKVSRRDIGHVMAHKLYGSTTIASTSILSSMAGISVFGTGGLGGVHREGQWTFDISNDLLELGRNPITVVCAGPKSILDIGLTMEYLETQGVYVSTFDDGLHSDKSNIEIPGFYTRNSGIKSPNSFNDFKDIASIIYHQQQMNLNSGNVVCIPPLPEHAMDSEYINSIISNANEEAKSLGISGKDTTPFLLLKIGEMTKGRSLDSNKNFVKNNIKCATKIAKQLSKFKDNLRVMPNISNDCEVDGMVDSKTNSLVNTLIIGSLALDSISKLTTGKLYDSNPGTTKLSIGGVGHNIALASSYCDPDTSRLVLIVSNDYIGNTIQNELQLDNSCILVDEENLHKSASYTSIHNETGELIIACADMNIIESDFTDHINNQIQKYNPKTVVADCNLSPKVLEDLINYSHTRQLRVIIEPTSIVKCEKLSKISLPLQAIDLITPTKNELDTIYDTFMTTGKFDTDEWFGLLDHLQFNQINNLQLPLMIKSLYNQGYIQKCFKLLPYFPNIMLKLGLEGVLSIGINDSGLLLYNNTNNQGHEDHIESYKVSTDKFYIDYYPIPQQNKDLSIVNVTGAGDTFLGYIISHLQLPKALLIHNAQLAAGLSICYNDAISPKVKDI